MSRSVMWHDGVKITARSGGSGLLGAVLALAVAVAVIVGAVALVNAIPWAAVNAVLTCVAVAVIAAAGVVAVTRHLFAEARLDALAERTEHTYQRREAERRRQAEQHKAPIALPPAPPRALPAPTLVDLIVDQPDHAEEPRR